MMDITEYYECVEEALADYFDGINFFGPDTPTTEQILLMKEDLGLCGADCVLRMWGLETLP